MFVDIAPHVLQGRSVLESELGIRGESKQLISILLLPKIEERRAQEDKRRERYENQPLHLRASRY
jgi:hypothetical protein